MDLALIQKGLRDLKASAGPKAAVDLTIQGNGLYVYFRPTGEYGTGAPCIIAHGDTPAEALAKARAEWDEMSARVVAEQTKKIAIAIIRITHEQGQCTDAALRVEFDAQDLDQYRAEALTLANAMAENGPFEIVELAAANAA